MKLDQDIKIASDRPSQDVKRDKALKEIASDCSAADISNAKALGRNVAKIFIADATEAEKNDENGNSSCLFCVNVLFSTDTRWNRLLASQFAKPIFIGRKRHVIGE